MNVPAGTPDFVIVAIETMEETASQMMRNQSKLGSSTGISTAAGYFLAVTDIKEMLDTHAKLEAGDREAKAKEALDRHQREVNGEPS